jgi:hypothetical protein
MMSINIWKVWDLEVALPGMLEPRRTGGVYQGEDVG